MKTFRAPRGIRREHVSTTGRVRGGWLVPVHATFLQGSEGGMYSQQVTIEADPLPGRLLTPVTVDLTAVAVPVTAVDALLNPTSDYAGLEEVVREKFLSGNPIFGLEAPGPVTDQMEITPRSIGGALKVDKGARIAHAAAVNFLRLRRYVKATKVNATLNAITPAIISQTVLDRFNAVLDPDDRVDGAVQLDMPTMQLPVTGIGINTAATSVVTNQSVFEAGSTTAQTFARAVVNNGTGSNNTWLELDGATMRPAIFAQLNGAAAGNLSLREFFTAKTADDITRMMRQIIDENPQYGQEMALRWAHGLSVDPGRVPFVIAERSAVLGRDIIEAQDGAGIQTDIMRSDLAGTVSFSVPVPKTELGYYIITFLTVRPDETIANQPHPILSDNIMPTNYAAEELKALDPVPVYMRDLNALCGAANENVRAFYTGLNTLKQTYVKYGFSRALNTATVAAKTAIWQYLVPLSVDPGNILYPGGTPGHATNPDLSHYPFADQLGKPFTYTITSVLAAPSPMIIGSTPVENVEIIDQENIFQGEI